LNLKKILIKSKREVFSEQIGNNSTAFLGDGFDFDKIREYEFSDDVRHISWKITAKYQKPYVKLFKEERELNILIVSLLGASMGFGSKRLKSEVASEVNAILAFSSVKNSDIYSSMIFTNKLEFIQKASKQMFGVSSSTKAIYEFETFKKRVDYESLSEFLIKKYKKKSLLFLIGDFVGEIDFSRLARKFELYLVIIRDEFEENPANIGQIQAFDMSEGKSLWANFDNDFNKKAKSFYKENDIRLFKHCRKNRVKFVKIYTKDEVFIKLTRLFLGS
jgi:uncharacterized protein (DUF58 family)